MFTHWMIPPALPRDLIVVINLSRSWFYCLDPSFRECTLRNTSSSIVLTGWILLGASSVLLDWARLFIGILFIHRCLYCCWYCRGILHRLQKRRKFHCNRCFVGRFHGGRLSFFGWRMLVGSSKSFIHWTIPRCNPGNLIIVINLARRRINSLDPSLRKSILLRQRHRRHLHQLLSIRITDIHHHGIQQILLQHARLLHHTHRHTHPFRLLLLLPQAKILLVQLVLVVAHAVGFDDHGLFRKDGQFGKDVVMGIFVCFF
mmetsp:Transcript_40405/g.72812  ORF Transcript_40405/g.72812 Transcript_40405/m.72812 type:complete len:259 (-) Transcript_40405:692-1468(-)